MTTWRPIARREDLPLPSDRVEESEFLDFKAEPWKSGDDGSREIARDVAQFANHLGGSIIVGAIEDDQDRLSNYKPVPDVAAVAQRITDVCHTWFFPRLEVHPTMLATIEENHPLLVVNIEPFDGVVAIKPRGKDYSEFYRRFGKGKKMTNRQSLAPSTGAAPLTLLTAVSSSSVDMPKYDTERTLRLGD